MGTLMLLYMRAQQSSPSEDGLIVPSSKSGKPRSEVQRRTPLAFTSEVTGSSTPFKRFDRDRNPPRLQRFPALNLRYTNTQTQQRTMRKILPVQETITYPWVTVTSTYDPCHDSCSPYEHVLAYGHLITTPEPDEPDEPCAPNCYDALQTDSRQASRMTLSKALEKDFYCDACVEERTAANIDVTDSCKRAGLFSNPARRIQQLTSSRRKDSNQVSTSTGEKATKGEQLPQVLHRAEGRRSALR